MPQHPTSSPQTNDAPRAHHRQSSRTAPTSEAKQLQPAADPLAALERARKLAFEEQEAERWDGLC